MKTWTGAVVATLLTCSGGLWAGPSFEKPIRLQAGGEFIDTEIGHAAPFVGDYNGDGLKDLLVGQFGGGKLWIFPNEGTSGNPRFAPRELFPGGTVPAG